MHSSHRPSDVMQATFIVKLRPFEYEEEVEIPDGLTEAEVNARCRYWVRRVLERAIERPDVEVHNHLGGLR